MKQTELRQKLELIVAEVFELSPEDLPVLDEFNLEYLGDSLKHLELFAIIERDYGVSVESEHIRSFYDLVGFVNEHARIQKP